MSGEGVLPFDRRGGCLCGSLPVNRQHPCPLCADERDYRPGDRISWGGIASSTMEHFSHDPDVND